MDIKIVYIKLGQITSDELWQGSFEDAKEVAESAIEHGNAERVEILDSHGVSYSITREGWSVIDSPRREMRPAEPNG